MNKLCLLLLILMFVVPVAAVKVEHRGVPVYFFHYKINQTECFNNLDLIPYRYWSNVSSFKFYLGKNQNFEGLYFWYGKKVNVLDGCSLGVLVHELAHHKQDMDGIRWSHGDLHNDSFIERENMIWRDIYGTNN